MHDSDYLEGMKFKFCESDLNSLVTIVLNESKVLGLKYVSLTLRILYKKNYEPFSMFSLIQHVRKYSLF